MSKVDDNLYKAVQEYIEDADGSVVVIGGVEIIKMPLDLKYNYRLAIRITGQLPKRKPDALKEGE